MHDFDQIAQAYVASLGEISPGITYGFADKKEFFAQVYYDFVYRDASENPTTPNTSLGGACGFCIDKKTTEVTMLSFGELAALEDRQRDLEELYQKITGKEGNPWAFLKSQYQLNSAQLLQLKKLTKGSAINKEEVLEKLNNLMQRNP